MSRLMTRFAYGVALAMSVALSPGAGAQQTKAQLNTYNNSHISANGHGAITGSILNADIGNIITAMCGLAQASDCPLSASSLTGILSVSHGGSGTATPSLVAGANITVSGSWPNQTVAAGGSLVPGGTSSQLQYNNSGAFGGFTVGGDGTLNTGTGALTVGSIGGKAVSLGGSFTTTGAFGISLAAIGATSLTLPTSGTLATVNGALGTPTSVTLTNATGLPTSALTGSLATTSLSGTLQAAQEPAHTGDATNSAGSLALTIPNGTVTSAKMASGAAVANFGNTPALPGILTIGSGSNSPLSYTNTPNVTGTSTVFPTSPDTSNIPALAIERSTIGGNPSFQSNETLYVGTHLNLQSPSSFYWGINNQVQIDHNAAPNGNGAYAEAMRSDCEIGSAIDQTLTCWGGVFLSRSNNASTSTFNIGIEAVAATASGDAPTPPSFVSNFFSVAYLAGSGGFAPQDKFIDAAYMVNNFLPIGTGGGVQAGFECPKETSTVASIAWACMYGASKTKYAIDISNGTWLTDQIIGVGWLVDPNGGLSIYGTTPIGLDMRFGTFATDQIIGTGFVIDPAGVTTSVEFSGVAALPTISSCGTSPPSASAGSTNNGGQITFGTGTPTSCVVTFAKAFYNHAYCTVTPATAYTGTYYVSVSNNTGFLVTIGTGTDSVKFNYTCMGS